MQYNVYKRDVVQHTALQQAYEDGIDIILLQEPYFTKITNNKEHHYITLIYPAYYIILPQSDNLSNILVKPRVVTYIRKTAKVDFNPLYSLSDLDMQLIEVYRLETFHILNVYNEQRRPNQ